MLRSRPLRFTDAFDDWTALLEALGFQRSIEAPGWHVFDSAQGRVALHAASGSTEKAGTTRLAFEVGDLDEFARRTEEAGTRAVITEEAHGRTATMTGPDGIAFTADPETTGPLPGTDPGMHVLQLWVTPDTAGATTALQSIGARLEVVSETGGWAQLRARNGGLAAVHTGVDPRIDLSFEYDGDAGLLLARLLGAGLDAHLVDESYGRTVKVADPDGGEDLWITEKQRDLYGYRLVDVPTD
ncbi:VOC family protein [Zafaria sp. Z1313]|uniref:VOC family protein n=1 Tax=unclassified Zafaria TaxID=2828765 RepID=UPI002E795286|nr:VOC family protein [Zafaria sp. J156]MEE1621848.1 VOC family protein [Zafaria sp. J156]